MTIVFDCKLKRPACVHLNILKGGSPHIIAAHFPPETWLLSPTPDMHCYGVTEQQLPALVNMAMAQIK